MSSDTPEDGSPPNVEEADAAPVAPEAAIKPVEVVPPPPQTSVEPPKVDPEPAAKADGTKATETPPVAGGRPQSTQGLVPFGVAFAAVLQGFFFYALLPKAHLFPVALIGAGIAALLYRVCFTGRAQPWRIAGVLGGATLAANLILGAVAPNLATQLGQQIAALGGKRNTTIPVLDTGRLSTIIQRQVIAIDVEHGPPAADIRDFPAPGPVGYHANFANARNDTLQVTLMSGDQIVSRCKPYVMNGAGDYACQLPNVETGEYRFDVAINTVSIARLNFGVGQTTNVRPPDAGPLPGDKPKEEEKPAPPPPPPAATTYIAQPPWRRMPSGDDLAREMPQRAIDAGVSGRVVLSCTIVGGGRVSCSVESEEPRGYGFGEAALRASRNFRMDTKMADGRGTQGMQVRIPVRFAP